MPSRHSRVYRRRGPGVPALAVILLLVAVLAAGLILGYVFRARLFPGLYPAATPQAADATAPGDGDDQDAEPLSAAEAAGLLSGDADAAALSEPVADAQEIANDELSYSVDTPVVAAVYDGGQVLVSEVLDAYSEEVNAFLLDGMPVTGEDLDALEEVLRQVTEQRVARVKAEEMGLTTITEEEQAQLQDAAEARFEALVASAASDLQAGENLSAEAARTEAIRQLSESEGIDQASILGRLEENLWQEKLYAELTGDVTLAEETLENAYEALTEEQKAAFDAYTDDYEYARLNGELVAYNPAGYRKVRHILLPLEGEALEA